MWKETLLWWCQLFGYASCSQLSTFEAIVLAVVALMASSAALVVALAILGLIAGALLPRN